MEQALIVFAKIPESNKVKTRLTTLLSPEEAAELYEAFLIDALHAYLALDVHVRLYLGPSDLEVPEELRPEGIDIYWQKGAGLGPRMAAAFAETFVTGYKRAVIIGTDHPTLPESFINQAFHVLDEPKAISIGPSEDGGYYLLGMNEFYAQVFEEMTYSHPQVFAQTVDRVGLTGAMLHVLPSWYDVDTPEALIRLNTDLKTSNEPLPRTRTVMSKLERDYGLNPVSGH